MANSIELLVSTTQAQAYIGRRRDAVADMLAERIDAVNAMFADRVKRNLSGGVLQERTGALLSTVRQEPAQRSGDELYGAVTAGGDEAPYGIYFEDGGSGYYDIVPVNARVLSFMGEGGRIFAKIIHHPPTPKLPWFAPEVETGRADMEKELSAALDEGLA